MNSEGVERAVCQECGRRFLRTAFHVAKIDRPVCAGCIRLRKSSGGYEPMIQVEVGEYQRLLKLYYAAFEMSYSDEVAGDEVFAGALQQCNKYFEGGAYARC